MLSNKHILAAVIVGPILSVLAWIGVGQLTAETPAPAQPGQSYPLLEKSGCRYSGGDCQLENEDLQLTLRYVEGGSAAHLELRSSHALDGAVMSVASPGKDSRPLPMQPPTDEGQPWALSISSQPAADDRIYLVIGIGEATYYGDASTTFLRTQ
ncbi:MAG: hypothetical protein ACI9JM_000638 [Halioglobus sp.]|jgi:hypothetical protein